MLASPLFPIDGKNESEVAEIAQSLSFVRPLVPYPSWRFDADWGNPDLAFQMRQEVWQFSKDRNPETRIILDWLDGLRLAMHLGSDLSRQIFVGGCIDPNEFTFAMISVILYGRNDSHGYNLHKRAAISLN